MSEASSPPATETRARAELQVYREELEAQNEELRQSQLDLESTRRKYFQLFELAPVGYFVFDSAARILDINLAGAALIGIARKRALESRHLTPWVDHATLGHVQRHLERLWKTGDPQREEIAVRLFGGDRKVVWLESTLMDAASDDGRACLTAALDVTDRHRAEAARNRALEDLAAQNEEMEKFALTVGHDLKSPLLTIQGYLERMAKALEAKRIDRLPEQVAKLQSTAHRMKVLLQAILEVARAGRPLKEPQTIRVNQIVDEVLELLAGRIEASGATIRVQDAMPPLRGDPLRMREVFQNLVENALKYMGDQPAPFVEIGCRRRQGETAYFVSDNGIGLPPSERETVFGLFAKIDAGSEGAGMGLALIRRIVEQHGGRIWAESDGPGKGASFWFVIPEDREKPNRS